MTKIHTSDVKSTAIRLLIGLPIVGLVWVIIIKIIGESHSFNWYILLGFSIVGISLGSLSLLSTSFGKLTFRAWHRLVYIIDQTIIWVSLPIFYYLFFCPYSLLLGLFGKSKIKTAQKPHATYWKKIEQPNSKRRYINQF